LTWTLDGMRTDVGPGEALLIPRDVVHQFENKGEVVAKALAIGTPGVLGPDYFREAAAVLEAAADGPPDFAAIAAVMRRHGLTPTT
jgi:quercetin dioxygenase-like cupin family protein